MFVPFKYSLLFLLLLQACTQVQETSTPSVGFKVIGSFPTIPDSVTIYMKNAETHKVDSTYIVNGEFVFTGQLEHPMKFNIDGINYKAKKVLFLGDVFVENSVITMEEKDDKLIVVGSKIEEEENVYYQGLSEVKARYQGLVGKMELGKEDSLKLEKYTREIKDAKIDFYTKNLDSYVTANQMMWESFNASNDDRKLSKNELSRIYPQLTKRIKDSFYGKAIARYLRTPEMPNVGDRYADFTMLSADGGVIKLSDLEGKYVLVDFWASWCHPCRLQNPHLVQLYKQYNRDGLEILGVSLDEDIKAWLDAIEKDNLTWTNGRSEGGRFSEVSQLYRVNGIPDNLIVNPEGIIIGRKLRATELERFLENTFLK